MLFTHMPGRQPEMQLDGQTAWQPGNWDTRQPDQPGILGTGQQPNG